jgi:hypothetical protein
MDLNNIKKQVSNLTLYDIKAGVRKVQNGMWHTVACRIFSLRLTGFNSSHELH